MRSSFVLNGIWSKLRAGSFSLSTVIAFCGLAWAEPSPPDSTLAQPAWDQVENIKDAAARIGKLQRAKGSEAAYKFIDACYRTHSLAENYSKAFESCIAQDYLQTKMLVQLYSRTPPETLKKLGSPSPEKLSEIGGRRIVAAFAQYKIPVRW